MKQVVITSAKRTPIGKFLGSLSHFSAVQLGTFAARAALKYSGLKADQINQVIFGNVLQAGEGQNVARQIELNAGIPNTATAYTVNQVCGSGMRAIRNGEAALLMNDAKVILVGGTESMSNAPFLCQNIRSLHKIGNIPMKDDLQTDALLDAFSQQPMGLTAENVAQKYHVSREQQDRFAIDSYRKAIYAQNHHYFDKEIASIKIHTLHGDRIFKTDECVRKNTSLAKLAQLKPVFKKHGTVTAGNASGLSDGASALIMMRKDTAQELHIQPLATINNYAEAGIDPKMMGYAPYYAIKKLLKKERESIKDIDLFEFNEAFAAQSVAVTRDLGIPAAKLNINGGAIALGHPLGDSGSRIIITLINNLRRKEQHTGIAALCIGGGMGMAIQITC